MAKPTPPANMPNQPPADIRTLASQHTAAAVATLASLLDDPKASPSVRLAAAQALIALARDHRTWAELVDASYKP